MNWATYRCINLGTLFRMALEAAGGSARFLGDSGGTLEPVNRVRYTGLRRFEADLEAILITLALKPTEIMTKIL